MLSDDVILFFCNVDCDRPALKYLNKYVRKEVSPTWHDLGTLNYWSQKMKEKLIEIQSNNQVDVNECCKQMFQLWLQKCR